MARGDAAPGLDEELRKAYADRHLALGLGAGVSQSSNLPGWNELVCRVGDRLGVTRKTVTSLLDARFDATVVASYLRSRAGSHEKFVEAVRASLYRDFTFREAVGRGNHRRFAAHIRETNPTLHAVGTLCGIRVDDDRYAPNPRVRAIMTLNIDALLEIYTRARFRTRVLRTVERASASASSSRIHSYHIHGFLIRDLPSGRPSRSVESDDRLVLTEQQYFDVVANASGFVNYTMLHLLREHRFLFVGLSMTDPNLRRALHLSFSERVRELQAEGETEADSRRRADRHWAVVQRRGREIDAATAGVLHVLGVTPIWIREWLEVPALLRALYETTGDCWDDAT